MSPVERWACCSERLAVADCTVIGCPGPGPGPVFHPWGPTDYWGGDTAGDMVILAAQRWKPLPDGKEDRKERNGAPVTIGTEMGGSLVADL